MLTNIVSQYTILPLDTEEPTDLRGANLDSMDLSYANLAQADLNQATLRETNLEGAILTEANCIGANFTRAKLTAACLEAWNIDSTTVLEDIDCDFVFLLQEPDARGNRERRPHDPDTVFQSGDFEKLYRQIMNTVEILLRNGMNPDAFRQAFQQLMSEHPEIDYNSIQSIEKKGDDVLVKIAVPEETDKGEVEHQFRAVYEARLAAAEDRARLADRYNQDLVELLKLKVSQPLTISQSQGDVKVSNNPNSFSISNASDVQVTQGDNNFAAKGDNSTFVQGDNNQIHQGVDSEQITPQQVVELLAYLESRIQNLPEFPAAEREKSTTRLASAKVEAQETEPDKESIAKNLKRVNESLKEASTTSQGIKEFIQEVAPTVVKIAGWLGTAAGSIWMV
ncbi:MAG: pentapeptide repeat-containing protein [Microcoleaceae cyanobacterium]